MADDDLGVDVKALDDLPDPEEMAEGKENVAYAQARRFLQPAQALEEIGYLDDFESLDVRDLLGRRVDAAELAEVQAAVDRAASADDRIEQAQVTLTQNANGTVTIKETHDTAVGTSSLVLEINNVTADLLLEG